MDEAQIVRKILANTPNKPKQQSKMKCENYMTDPNCMEKMYQVMDELGSGGFGKVKLALHILTGERVAIKIIDKKAIANDLPRVTSELEALKQLAHQNICRMFQFVETEEKYYIVMEYCNGGEMFDYIIKKERLSESEARHFFRQLVQAVAYIHSMGFAHRDLKPENLLLTQELQLKVIDFGLCAKPLNGLTKPLETCCGSPAYAAPELIQDHFYYGNEADIWSMGVLLYALLCGMLPFDDSNMPRLYKRIMAGIYVEPEYLSPLSRDFLRSMLTVDPKKRATIKQILAHPWLNKNYNQQLKWQTIYSRDVIDEDVLRELVYFYGVGMVEMEERIKEWNFDYLTATYLILLKKKEQKQNFALPFYHETKKLPCSPTIHASLGNDLDFSGVEFDGNSSSPTDESDDRPSSVPMEKFNTMSLYVQHKFAHSPQKVEKQAHNYQNAYQKPKQQIVLENQQQPKSVYTTPRRKPIVSAPLGEIVSPALYRRPNSVERSRPPPPELSITPTTSMTNGAGQQQRTPIRTNSIDQPTINTPSETETPSSTCERVARRDTRRAKDPEGAKSPSRLRQRVFSSLERKADRMIHLLTPKKIRTDGPTKLKCMKTMVNVSVTSSSDAAQVRDELWKVLRNQGMETTQTGWKICGSKKSETTPTTTTVELEVVSIDGLQYVGVKRKRIRGDAFMYKRICEEVLRLAGL